VLVTEFLDLAALRAEDQVITGRESEAESCPRPPPARSCGGSSARNTGRLEDEHTGFPDIASTSVVLIL
jgi:hypothetical protein